MTERKKNNTTTKNKKHRDYMMERKMALGNFGGRPAKYETVEELEKAIQEYFDMYYCDENIIRFKNTKLEEIGWDFIRVPSITGLTLHLGFQHRQSLIDYDEKAKFSDTIKRAKLFIENFNEERLLQGKGYGPGIMFNLKNNFNWKDKSEVDQNVKGSLSLLDIHKTNEDK